jgi:hypothetical protein
MKGSSGTTDVLGKADFAEPVAEACKHRLQYVLRIQYTVCSTVAACTEEE